MILRSISILMCLMSASAWAAAKTIDMKVTIDGYQPKEINVPAGTDLTLKVTRTTNETCAKEIVVPSRNLKVDLPLNKTVLVKLGKVEKGEIKFGCAMQMMESGVVFVK